MTTPTHNVVGWFEIPALDMERAITFYETVFGYTLERHPMGPLDMAWFPNLRGSVGACGALVKYEQWYKPTLDGPLIYFTAFSGDLSNELSRVEKAGGKIWVPKKQISEDVGYMACIEDTEGNRIAIHSKK